ncbi:MAG: NADPH-dependent FMN reductase [Aestuariibacter sp.]
MAKILAFAGSTRKDSYNKKLAKVAADAAVEAGAEVTFIDLADYSMPIFCEDLEAASGMPEKARAFKEMLMSHDGFLISSPEYNSSYPAVLKNAIDWASRMEDGEKPLQAFKGKVAGIMAASPGALGGLRCLVTLRMLLGNIGVHVIPNQKAVSKAHEQFAEDGSMIKEKQQAGIAAIAKEVVELANKFS